MQCVGASVAAVGAASGIRAYLAMKRPFWLTAARMKLMTVVLFAGALLAASVSLG